MDWLHNFNDDVSKEIKILYENFLLDIDTIVMGRKTYDVINELTNGYWPYPKNLKTYVITNRLEKNQDNVEFIQSDFLKAAKYIDSKAKKNVSICGGANIIKQYLENNAIDEMIIFIIPIILGDGIPLFLNSSVELQFDLKKVAKHQQLVELRYTKKRKWIKIIKWVLKSFHLTKDIHLIIFYFQLIHHIF